MPMNQLERARYFDPPAGFDEPLDMLLGCHRRIEKQLQTLERLRAHLRSNGVDPEASIAARNVLRYFDSAAAHHHADEEQDLFPMLEERIGDEAERERFHALRARLLEDHRRLEAAWQRLRRPLEGIAEGLSRALTHEEVAAFVEAYSGHLAREEPALGPWIERWLDEADRLRLGRAMAARRGLPAR